jgi:DinB family protein
MPDWSNSILLSGTAIRPPAGSMGAIRKWGGVVDGTNPLGEEMMTQDERKELVAKYAAGFDEVAGALAGFPIDRLTANLIPGKWSAAEIVQHLADSEMTSAIRLRRLLVEDKPVIQGYDQDLFATRLRYNERDVAPALEAFRAARSTTTQLLERMTEEDWRREGTHSESGRYTTEDWLRIYAGHAHGHADQIRRLREKLS